ncbi:hypothetical protein [Streptomyces sp. SID3343]|nr:hypothetical protein [Streptomyces sp. SID3343]
MVSPDDLPDDIVDYGLAGIRHPSAGEPFGTHGWERRASVT